jgi:hypothetical protein
MRPVPDNFSLEAFVGQRVEQLRIAIHQLTIHFEGDHRIECWGEVSVESHGQTGAVMTKDGWGDLSMLRGIAGQNVVAWKVEGSHEFSITLDTGTKIRFHGRSERYEDFYIHPQAIVI